MIFKGNIKRISNNNKYKQHAKKEKGKKSGSPFSSSFNSYSSNHQYNSSYRNNGMVTIRQLVPIKPSSIHGVDSIDSMGDEQNRRSLKVMTYNTLAKSLTNAKKFPESKCKFPQS